MNTVMLKIMDKRFLGLICLIIFIGFFLFGLWPFNFIPENEVKWLSNTGGINFYGRGIIYAPDLLNGKNPPFQSDSITVELWIQPNAICDCTIARILSFYDGNKSENFFIGQWKSDLIVRNRLTKPNYSESYKEVIIDNVLIKDKKTFITITSENEGTTFYIDGKQVKSYPQYRLINDNKSSGYLIIGNSYTGMHYWTGDIYGLTIYNHVLTHDQVFNSYYAWTKNEYLHILQKEDAIALYLFNERMGTIVKNHSNSKDLTIPVKFTPLKKTILSPPWESFEFNRFSLKDTAINFFGFIPFGFFFLALLWDPTEFKRLRVSTLVVLIGGGLSLIIEVIQANLPTRFSSLTDLILNTIGTAVGVIIFHMVSRNLENIYQPL